MLVGCVYLLLFRDCYAFDQDISGWKGPAATTPQYAMLRDADAFLAKYICTSGSDGPASSCVPKWYFSIYIYFERTYDGGVVLNALELFVLIICFLFILWYYIGEVLIFDEKLTDEERATVTTQLMNKWVNNSTSSWNSQGTFKKTSQVRPQKRCPHFSISISVWLNT